MELSTAQQILVIILSSALAIFLILSIVIAVLAIRLVQQLRFIASKAEKIIETASVVGDAFKKTSGTIGLFRFIQSIVNIAHHKRDNKE